MCGRPFLFQCLSIPPWKGGPWYAWPWGKPSSLPFPSLWTVNPWKRLPPPLESTWSYEACPWLHFIWQSQLPRRISSHRSRRKEEGLCNPQKEGWFTKQPDHEASAPSSISNCGSSQACPGTERPAASKRREKLLCLPCSATRRTQEYQSTGSHSPWKSQCQAAGTPHS